MKTHYHYIRITIFLSVLVICSFSEAMAQWEKTNFPESIPYQRSYPMAYSYKDNYVFLSPKAFGKLYRSSDYGKTWVEITQNLGGSTLSIIYSGKYLVASAAWLWMNHDDSLSGIYRSADNGNRWERIADKKIRSALLFMKDSNVLYGTVGGKFLNYSIDDGNSWSQRETDLQGQYFTAFTKKGSIFYASTYLGRMYRSIDSLRTWEVFDNGLLEGSINFKIATVGDDLFALVNEALMRTPDSIASWTDVSRHPLISIPAVSGDYLFATATEYPEIYDGIILSSSDHGNTWKNITDNFFGKSCHFLFTNDLYLFACTDSGLWRRPLFELKNSVREKLNESNPNLVLSPNPTSGAGNISYTLPKSSQVRIEINNAIGQRLQTLTDKFESEGSHTKSYDISHFPTGEYFFRFQADGISQVKTLQRLK